jgi:hypothetical protein
LTFRLANMQFVTSLSLIAVLLACPQVCRWQSSMVAPGAGQSQGAPICPCCPKGNGQSPSQHDPSNNGGPPIDCICKGAVCTAAITPAMIDIDEPIGWLVDFAVHSDITAAQGDLSPLDESTGRSSAASGRAMRLLMASLRF